MKELRFALLALKGFFPSVTPFMGVKIGFGIARLLAPSARVHFFACVNCFVPLQHLLRFKFLVTFLTGKLNALMVDPFVFSQNL